jgi:hypothetical protein
MEEKMLSLPWQVQVALGCGYSAYMLAYVGIRDHHKATDITFKSIAFGQVAVVALLTTSTWRPVWAVIDAIVWSLIAGVLWRRWGSELLRSALRGSDTSWADDTPSAWASLTVCNSKYFVGQISVELDDGTWLRCIDTRPFEGKPFGPMTIGVNGDVALYVTKEERPDGTEIIIDDVSVEYWGDRITYVPASKIKRVALRHS